MTFDCRSGNSDCCTPRVMGRGVRGSATAVRAEGSICVAKAPSVRARLKALFNVSVGRRPHLEQRCSSKLFRDPQKLQVILLASSPGPGLLRCANFGF